MDSIKFADGLDIVNRLSVADNDNNAGRVDILDRFDIVNKIEAVDRSGIAGRFDAVVGTFDIIERANIHRIGP
jgi:hypothetical protein